MREMRIIDLLTNVYNGQNVPNHIEFHGIEYTWDSDKKEYMGRDGQTIGTRWDLDRRLNDNVEYFDMTTAPITKLSLTDKDGLKHIPSDIQVINKINEIIDYITK